MVIGVVSPLFLFKEIIILLIFFTLDVTSQSNDTSQKESIDEIVTSTLNEIKSKLDLLAITQNCSQNSPIPDVQLKAEICSLNSRVMKQENEMKALKLMLGTSPASVVSLDTADKTRDQNTNTGNVLDRLSFNIFFRKPANVSSTYDDNYPIINGLDGDQSTRYISKEERNPWLCVDLEVPHVILQITISFKFLHRASGLRIYVANEKPFDSHGAFDQTLLSLFAKHVGDATSSTVQFVHPKPVRARYVIISREVSQNYLSFLGLSGVGYT